MPLLEVQGASKRFGGITAVNEVSFSLEAGGITSLIGPNGAGKTSLFNIISGFVKPDRGTFQFNDRRVDGWRPHSLARAGLVRTFQSPRVLTKMTVLDNVMLAAPNHPGERFGMQLVAPRVVSRYEKRWRERALEVLTLTRLLPLRDAFAAELSGGQRKLLEFSRVLMLSPKLILLDEPMAGVAPTLRRQLLEHIESLCEQQHITFLIVEHDMEVVMEISDRVMVMDEGALVADGSPESIQGNERVIEAYLGRFAGDKREDWAEAAHEG